MYRLYEGHKLVWAYRNGPLKEFWPTPPRIDSYSFASTEANEALDAYLRNKNYARNNDKTLNVGDELADCAMMLYTGWGDTLSHLRDSVFLGEWAGPVGSVKYRTQLYGVGYFSTEQVVLYNVIYRIGEILVDPSRNPSMPFKIIGLIAKYPEFGDGDNLENLNMRVEERLKRIKQKWMPED